jgi:short-subunit dehydrogenase
MKETLLIGGSGSVGTALYPYMKDYNAYVVGSKQFNVMQPHTWRDMDIVIYLAGISLLNELSKPHLLNKKVIEVNCMGVVNVLAHFIPEMQKRKYGRIIVISSVCSVINLPYHGVYSASKAFVDKLVKIAAIENAQYGITVNTIQLGYTGIGMSESTSENMERQKNKSALKRFVTMQELYNTIDYIIKTEAITGQNINLSGI